MPKTVIKSDLPLLLWASDSMLLIGSHGVRVGGARPGFRAARNGYSSSSRVRWAEFERVHLFCAPFDISSAVVRAKPLRAFASVLRDAHCNSRRLERPALIAVWTMRGFGFFLDQKAHSPCFPPRIARDMPRRAKRVKSSSDPPLLQTGSKLEQKMNTVKKMSGATALKGTRRLRQAVVCAADPQGASAFHQSGRRVAISEHHWAEPRVGAHLRPTGGRHRRRARVSRSTTDYVEARKHP